MSSTSLLWDSRLRVGGFLGLDFLRVRDRVSIHIVVVRFGLLRFPFPFSFLDLD